MEQALWKALEDVIDPEMYISIVDLGLVYEVTETNGAVHIVMTLTTIGCPLYPVIERDIHRNILAVTGVQTVDVTVVFDPPWSVERMSEKGRALLGI